MRAPIIATKHYVQFTEFSVASGTVTEREFVTAVAIQNVDTPSEVQEGSVIKACFIELWLVSNDSINVGSFVVTVEKVIASDSIPTLSEMSTLNSYRNKKNILFTSQGILGSEQNANPTPVLRQWIKIPRGKQRFGVNDQMHVHIAAIGTSALSGCSFMTYKEYR